MKKYFYSDGMEKYGPFSFEELGNEEIDSETLIWFEGLVDWTVARDLNEMDPILALKPPPIPINMSEKPLLLETEMKSQNNDLIKDHNRQSLNSKHGAFSNFFLFKGRIRRTEYAFSFVVFIFINIILNGIVETAQAPILGFAFIPLFWFLLAQGAKRCHDIGQSGWFQLIPFYALWMIFAKGDIGINKYGKSPKIL